MALAGLFTLAGAGWKQLMAAREGNRLKLYIDGKLVSESPRSLARTIPWMSMCPYLSTSANRITSRGEFATYGSIAARYD